MSALAACTSPSGHALHTKGWGSILLLHIFCSCYQVLVLAQFSTYVELQSAPRNLQLTCPSPCQALERRQHFCNTGLLVSLLLFCAEVKTRFSLHSQLNWQRFSEESVCNFGVILQQPPSHCNPLHCTIYKRCANRPRENEAWPTRICKIHLQIRGEIGKIWLRERFVS